MYYLPRFNFWLFKGNIVTSNGAWKVNETVRSIFETTKILLIRKAESRVMGQYICRASNSIGMAEARVQVYREYLTFIIRIKRCHIIVASSTKIYSMS